MQKKGTLLTALAWDSDGLESFLPCRINERIIILAVWTRQANSPTFGYIGQLWKYLQKHKEKLSASEVVISGDFNSNACWDVWDRWWNHSDVVNELAQLGIESAYHQYTGESQGKELQPTFFMYRKTNRPYHIDYAFLSSDLISASTISIGKSEEWLELSDHMPFTISITA